MFSNSYESLEFNRFIARQLSAHCDLRAGNPIYNSVTVCSTMPSLNFFADRVARKWSDILSCGVIVDRTAKDAEKESKKTDCGDIWKWNPQGYHTMMVPANEERWVKELFRDLDDCANERSPTGICAYVGGQRRLASKGKSNEEACSSSEDHHDDPTTPAMQYRLWRFQLLNYAQLRTIVNFRRERAALRGLKTKPRLQLRGKDFEVSSPYFYIALPTSESMCSPSSSPIAYDTGTAFQSLHTASRKRRMSTASSVSENSGADLTQPLVDGPQSEWSEGCQGGFFVSTAVCCSEQCEQQSPRLVSAAVHGSDMDSRPSAAVCANEPFCGTGGDKSMLLGQYGAIEGACDSSERPSSATDTDSLGEGWADAQDGEISGEMENLGEFAWYPPSQDPTW